MNKCTMAIVGIAAAAVATPAMAAISITQGVSAPTYATGINFDSGEPTGGVAANYWQGTHGIVINAGVGGGPNIDDWTTILGAPAGTANSGRVDFGAFMTFDSPQTAISFRYWDPSGDPSPFGGGSIVAVKKDGAEIATLSMTAAWGGVGDEWYSIIADGGMDFDEIVVLGYGFDSTSIIDDISWTPAPGSLALLGFAGVALRRRRA